MIKIIIKKKIILLFVLLILVGTTNAQSIIHPVALQVIPSRPDWKYNTGEEVVFHVIATKWGHPLKGITLTYEVGYEKMPPTKKGTFQQTDARQTISAGRIKTPGFIRCTVTCDIDGTTYRGLATAAIDPEKIVPVAELPEDFNKFWSEALEKSKQIPLDARMTLLPAKSSDKLSVYEVSFRNGGAENRIYGILSVPKAAGKFPAALQVPGAGVRAYDGDYNVASAGIITLRIGIHGVPVTMDNVVYQNLSAGPLSEYWLSKLDDRDQYYYRRVYLGCVRAVDFLHSLPQFDGSNLAVYGGSQGGALAIVTAALDPRVKYVSSFYPALCDLTGYLQGRAGGWPHMFANNNPFNNKPDKIATSKYYDVVNFARQLKVPGVYTFGYNDETCPPTSMFAAYNSITAPKQLLIYENTGHWLYPEQSKKVDSLMINKLMKNADKLE
ncbi:MAG TPA: acetylxylan esterase [Flavisolibacter sp.]|jgi:cephalosporin-C deacetylase-like acetyl esterase|nr:acetylxylan esterase [Flavisolibacter sp.]